MSIDASGDASGTYCAGKRDPTKTTLFLALILWESKQKVSEVCTGDCSTRPAETCGEPHSQGQLPVSAWVTSNMLVGCPKPTCTNRRIRFYGNRSHKACCQFDTFHLSFLYSNDSCCQKNSIRLRTSVIKHAHMVLGEKIAGGAIASYRRDMLQGGSSIVGFHTRRTPTPLKTSV